MGDLYHTYRLPIPKHTKGKEKDKDKEKGKGINILLYTG